MNKYLIIQFLLLITLCSNASDKYGYLGHNKYITYEFSYSSIDYNSFSFFTFHKLNYNYIFSENKMISLSFELEKNNIDKSDSYEIFKCKIFDKNIGIKMSWYRQKRGSIAPIGSYKGIGLTALFRNTYEYQMSYRDNNVNINTYKGLNPLLSFFWSRQYVAFDKITINYGLESGYFLYKWEGRYSHRYILKPFIGIGFIN